MVDFLLDDDAVPEKASFDYWGQIDLNYWECVWPKGSMPILFDPNIHKPSDRKVRIELLLLCIDEMQARWNLEFKTLQNSTDWAGKTLPSIKALGYSANKIHGLFAHVKKVPNGTFYQKKNPDKSIKLKPDGTPDMGENYDVIFVKIFASMDECVQDYNGGVVGSEDFAPIAGDVPGTVPAPAPAAAVSNGASMDMLINFARNFVKTAVKNHPGDLAAIMAEVKHQMEVKNSAFFAGKLAADSAEVTAMVQMEMG